MKRLLGFAFLLVQTVLGFPGIGQSSNFLRGWHPRTSVSFTRLVPAEGIRVRAARESSPETNP